MNSTKDKQCPVWGLVEVTQRDPLFKDASVCGDWCVRFDTEHNTCRDELLKEKLINNEP